MSRNLTRWLLTFLFVAVGAIAAPVGPIDYRVMPACLDTAGQHLNYNATTGAFDCGTSGGGSSNLTVGASSITGGTNTRVLYDNAGVLGEYALTGSGSVVMGTSPTISGLTVTGSLTATGLVTNADLANSSMTIGGQSISLGGATTNQGNGGKLQLSTGATTTNDCAKFDANGNVVDAGAACGTGSGTVTTTGSPASGNLTKFSGATSITNGNLAGDVTTTDTLTTTVGKVNGVSYPASPSTNTVPVVTSSNTITYETVPNAALSNSSTTVNGTTCTLGSSCTVTAAATGITVGSTTVGSGTSGRILYDNAGTLGELTVPLSVANGGTGLASGTSGGVLAYTASGTIASSGALTANAPVIGGGAGVAPSVGTRSGNTTTFGTTTGTLTSGNCAKFDASGNIEDAGAACGTGSGTVTSVTLATPSSTLTLGGTNPVTSSGTINADINLSHANTWAAAQSFNDGDIKLNGSSSGTTTLHAASAAGATAFTLPSATTDLSATGGSSQFLKQASAGGAITSAQVATTDLSGTITDELCASWDSNTSVVAATVSFPITWATYTITKVKSAVNGGGSFTANVKIGSTSVTSCSAISVSGSSNTNTTCTAANTGVADDIINVVITSPSGTVNQAYVCPVFTHSLN